MSTPASDQNEPSKMKKLISGNVDDSIRSRLPRGNGNGSTVSEPHQLPPSRHPHLPPPSLLQHLHPAVSRGRNPAKHRALNSCPAFWTIASVMSFTVNIVLIDCPVASCSRCSGLFKECQHLRWRPGLRFARWALYELRQNGSGKYSHEHSCGERNPVQFSLNVSGPTNVTLSQAVTINGALVTVQTGGLNIVNARATIVLPKDTVLPINIQNLVVPVDQKVLAVLDVPVDIPWIKRNCMNHLLVCRKWSNPGIVLLNPMQRSMACKFVLQLQTLHLQSYASRTVIP